MIKQEAEEIGRQMLDSVSDPGWIVRVWNNIGWHVSIQNAPISIQYIEFTNGKVGFLILMTGSVDEVGYGNWLCTMENSVFPSIMEALAAQVTYALERIETLQDAGIRAGEILGAEATALGIEY